MCIYSVFGACVCVSACVCESVCVGESVMT